MTKPGDADQSGTTDAPPTSAEHAPTVAASAPNPFAAPVRPPSERWINPAKRRSAGLLGAVAAIVLLVAGVLIGLAFGGGHDRGRNADAHCASRLSAPQEQFLQRRDMRACGGRAEEGWTFYRPGDHRGRPGQQGKPSRPGRAPARSDPASALPSSSHS